MTDGSWRWRRSAAAAILLLFGLKSLAASQPAQREVGNLRLAVRDLIGTFGDQYPGGREYLSRLDALEWSGDRAGFEALRKEALLANPLLDVPGLLLVRRAVEKPGDWKQLGMPTNHTCNSSLPRTAYDNEIAVLSPIRPDGTLTTLYRPDAGGYVGEIDLHWGADRLLFARSDRENWEICEIKTDGSGLRQVSQTPADVDCFDPCYLPNGEIVFGSTASYQSVPCWHGQQKVSNLYVMDADGGGVRQLCFDQDHDFHPTVLSDGQVLFHRWDYTGISHIFLRQLMVMKPDGTGQRAIYGSNSWYPNALYFPREVPGQPGRLVCILSGYHGVPRMGQLVIVDTNRGSYGTEGLTQRISGRGDPLRPMVRDNLVDDDWPKFLHPFPLGDKHFLVSCWITQRSIWAIYLADVFDNLVLVHEEPGYALLEPVPLARRPVPPAIRGTMDPERTDGVVYLHDIYAGPGLAGVPRGTIKSLRVLSYHFGYPGLAGPDKVGYGGPWEVMRIEGTVPLEPDGSAVFRAPANTPLAVQALDAGGKAVQLMRSWFTLMPGEQMSCIGCHERLEEAPPERVALAAVRAAGDIQPWYGPARGFDFAREVQPVLSRYCGDCHDGRPDRPDLRPEDQVENVRTWPIGFPERLHPQMKADTGGRLSYTPAYDVLVRRIRRVGIEDDVSLLTPGEYYADTSPLIQMLRKGHQGVQLDAEAWDRLVTWIDLNGPCHGTWGEVYPIPDGAHERRMALRKLYGGPAHDPEAIPDLPREPQPSANPTPLASAHPMDLDGWPFSVDEARQRQTAGGPHEKTVDLGDGVAMELVRIPAGEFVMGDANGEPDERPLARITIREPFWMGACEVTNAQYRRFDPTHDCYYYAKRHALSDDQGLPLNAPDQPVVRVSWQRAMAFCQWLSERTGMDFTLPTEAQWEYACRAGSGSALSYGGLDTDSSLWANVGDRAFSVGLVKDGQQVTGGLIHFVMEGADLADARFNDSAVVTAPVGSYRANAWSLYDMHGNSAEWTCSVYRPYPYRDNDGRSDPQTEGRKVVRGGSFYDSPKRCRSAFRLDYPPWQRVFNVGFRVVAEAS